jgi:hypothetical protein
MTSLNIERNFDSSSPLIGSIPISQALLRAKHYLDLCSLSEEEVESILQSLAYRMLDENMEHLSQDEAISVSMRFLQEILPHSFNRVREQRCKPIAELNQAYTDVIQVGSLRAKTCPTMQRSSVGSAALERISFNFGKSVS